MKLKMLLKKTSLSTLFLFAIANVNAQTLDVSNDADIFTWYILENDEYGQSFTAGLTGYLSQVDIHLQADGAFPLVPGDFEITIREGDGDQGDILGVETFSIIGDETTDFFSIDMPSDSIYLFPENTYTYFINRTSATGRLILNASLNVGIGKLYYYDGEGELQEEAAGDFKFQTYVNEAPQPNAEILFGDYFPNVQKWDIQSGELNYGNYIATTEGNNDMTIAFADFTRPLEAGETLELSFKSNEVTNFATNGWAGISLFTDDGFGLTEEVFIGSLGNESSWGIGGDQFADDIALTQNSPLVNVRFKYTFDSGDWMLDVAGETISGTIDASLAFNSIRIGADANNTANIAVSKLAVFTSAFLEENSYVHGDLTLCESGTTTIGVDQTYPELYYSLVDDQNELIDGKVEGNWSEITFETETITNTKKYNVSASKDYGVGIPNNNEYLRIDNPFYEYEKELTVEAWVNSSNGKFWSGQSTLDNNLQTNNVWLWEGGLTLNFYVNDNENWRNLLGPPLPNGWTHVSTVANETGLYIYYNGELVESNVSGIQDGIIVNDQSIMTFGQDPRFPNNADRNTNGSIDEIKIWNTTRTEEEIQLDMNGYDENDDNLVHYIPFGEGMGNIFADFKKSDAEAYIVNPSGNTWVNGPGINITSLLNSKLDPAVTVEIDEPVQVDVLDNVNLCNDEFTLPTLSVGNYFTGTNGGGDQLNADDVISATQTLYIFADNGTCTDESSFEINIYSALDAGITQDDLTLTVNQDNVSYQWLDCNNDLSPIADATNQSFTVTENGSYAVEVTLEGCSEISDCIIIDYLSIDKNELPTITLFPNPNEGQFTVDFGKLTDVNMTIRDITGKVIYNVSNIMSNTHNVMLDNSKGVYLVEISTETTHQVLRVVKQ